jgi:hypothetical protein
MTKQECRKVQPQMGLWYYRNIFLKKIGERKTNQGNSRLITLNISELKCNFIYNKILKFNIKLHYKFWPSSGNSSLVKTATLYYLIR